MSRLQPLRLGMFVMPIHDPAKPLCQCIDEDLELAVQCEELGFDDFWVGEHHSSSVENIVMPEIFLAKVLGLTERIRIGPAPWPAVPSSGHVAGRLAFLDHLSRGRLNVCFGPGAIPTDMEVFGGAPERNGGSGRRVDRHDLAAVDRRAADRRRRAVLERQDERQLAPRLWRRTPAQTVPAAAPADSRPEYQPSLGRAYESGRARFPVHQSSHDSCERLAGSVASLFAGGEFGRPSRAAFRLGGGAQRVRGGDDRGSPAAGEEQLTRQVHPVHPRLDPRTAPSGIAMWKRDGEQADSDCTLDYFMDDVVIAGDPGHVTERLLELREQIGPFGTLVLTAHDWDDRTRWKHSHELFGGEVVPAINKALIGSRRLSR